MLLALCLLGPVPGLAQERQAKPAEHKVYRIGIMEGGDYESQRTLLAIFKQALTNQGWGERVVFPQDAYISPGWDKGSAVYQDEARKLFNRTDLDLVIGMGTEGARALLAVNNGKIPIIGMEISDPVLAGMLDQDFQPTADNFTTCVTPRRWTSMVALFHHVMGFKRLGIMYHDTPDGRLYSNTADVREVARNRGFAVLEYSKLDHAESMADCLVGLKDLAARGIDAFYIGSLNCFDWSSNDPTSLLEFLTQSKIKTFAREGASLVHLGALMGNSSVQYRSLAEAHAQQMIAIFGGKRPRDLVKILEIDLHLSLNFQTAEALGVDFPLTFLISSDEIVSKTSTRQQWLDRKQAPK